MATLSSTLRLTLLDDVTARARRITGVLNNMQRQNAAWASPLRGLGGQLLAFTGAYVGVTQGMDATAGAAIRFESAFADVRKVVDATDEQFQNMRTTIKEMSNTLPIAATDIAALFAAAGESGVATADLKQFAEMAARVGIAFDMTAGEAGESLAKLKTQLGLTVAETGDMADAINFLSNNMASKAKDVTDFMLRVGALAEMGGFAKEEIAGIGSAMIAAGAESSTAATAMQNVVKALTRGGSAKKAQRDVAKALGLDLPTIAKQMQSDAKGTVRKVLAAIAKQPKENQLSILSDFFGDEAKAFAPLIGNLGLLDQALDSVSDKTKYSGSAFKEYVQRANTVGNVLQILRNKFDNLFSSLGDKMLPGIREAALGVGDIIDTLGERATVFDKMGAGMRGFLDGFGVNGGIREMVNDLGDLFLGVADGSKSADALGRVFAKFKQWGADFREFTDAVAANPLVQFFASLTPYGLQIAIWGVAIGALAGTIRSLAGALMFLSGASTIMAALKTIGTIAGIVGGGTTGAPGAPPAAAGGNWKTMLLGLGRIGVWATAAMGAYELGSQVKSGDTLYSQGKTLMPDIADLLHYLKPAGAKADPTLPAGYVGSGAQLESQRGGGNPLQNAVDNSRNPVLIDSSSIAAMIAPSGVQQVAVTNQRPPDIHMSNTFNITGITNPQAAADAAASQLGAKTKAAVEASYGGGGNF